MPGLNSILRTSASGMSVERFRMDVVSGNIANANSMKVGGQDPYRRRDVVIAGGPDGVRIVQIEEDQTPFRVVKDPSNQYADQEGNVTYSNVDPIKEMVNMISAGRSYEANVAAFNSAKTMIKSALNIGRV